MFVRSLTTGRLFRAHGDTADSEDQVRQTTKCGEDEQSNVKRSHSTMDNEFAAESQPKGLEAIATVDPDLNPGELSFEEDAAGGMGRHLGVFSCTLLIVGRIVGTGIFSVPASILGSVGSVGASLMLWILGSFLSFCGLFIWLELGTMFPRSGGEKVYLEAVYRRPKHLATVVFAINTIILPNSANGCIVFAENILVVGGHSAGRWVVRGVALGVYLMNGMTLFKIVSLIFIVITGWVVLSGHTRVEGSHANFSDFFAGSSHSSNDYATAMFKVLSAFGGWSTVNYVLNNVRDPVRTLKVSGMLGLSICAILNFLVNISYYGAATKEEIVQNGITVASLFFRNVFGEKAQKALTTFVAISALGNVITVSFSAARLNQELAKEGIPLPLGNRSWASNWPTGKAPLTGMITHFIPAIVVILAAPPSVAYPFIINITGYPQQVVNFFVVVGLFWLRWYKPNAPRPFKVWWPFAAIYLAAAVFLMIAPFLRPANGIGDTPPIPYYMYALVGIATLLAGVVYWAAWRVVPRWFGYEYVPRKDTLSDGTVVTLFSRGKIE
ncbi:amino acid transporter [Fomes fomentarius]|nr:amino acid transporter [Fomes fomentarius]